MADSQHAACYPTQEQYQQWKEHAEELDMGVSEFMKSMIEAGRKKFEVEVTPDETPQELREQRNDLNNKLDDAREEIDELERQLHSSERETIKQFIQDNPGATREQITQHVVDKAPPRISRILDYMEGNAVNKDGDQYYPSGENDGE